MTFVKFKYITKDRDRHGNVRLYFRRPGKPKTRLRGLPGSEEFLASYKEALGQHDPSKAKAEKSFEWLCERYYKSSSFQALEPETRRRKRVVLDEICLMAGPNGRRLGSAHFASMKRAHVRKLRDLKSDRPGAADLVLKTISSLFAWAIKNDLATVNPAEKLEKLGGHSEGFAFKPGLTPPLIEDHRHARVQIVNALMGMRARSDRARLQDNHRPATESPQAPATAPNALPLLPAERLTGQVSMGRKTRTSSTIPPGRAMPPYATEGRLRRLQLANT